MFDLILRQARLVDDTLADIAIKDGKIAALGRVTGEARATRDLNGEHYVSPGWIDLHVHCYPKSPIYHDEPDAVGVTTGVTTVVDAGSTGANDIDDFYALTRGVATEVLALLNVSKVGLIAQNELADMANIDAAAAREAIARHPDFIVGLKARMSSSVVGENGIAPLERAKAIQQENGNLPLMVHIGNGPVRSLAHVMSKFLAIGLSLPQVIDCVTLHAAQALRLAHKGQLTPGADADLTIFDLRRQPVLFTDADEETLHGDYLLVPLATVRAGAWHMTEQGSAEHAFSV